MKDSKKTPAGDSLWLIAVGIRCLMVANCLPIAAFCLGTIGSSLIEYFYEALLVLVGLGLVFIFVGSFKIRATSIANGWIHGVCLLALTVLIANGFGLCMKWIAGTSAVPIVDQSNLWVGLYSVVAVPLMLCLIGTYGTTLLADHPLAYVRHGFSVSQFGLMIANVSVWALLVVIWKELASARSVEVFSFLNFILIDLFVCMHLSAKSLLGLSECLHRAELHKRSSSG